MCAQDNFLFFPDAFYFVILRLHGLAQGVFVQGLFGFYAGDAVPVAGFGAEDAGKGLQGFFHGGFAMLAHHAFDGQHIVCAGVFH